LSTSDEIKIPEDENSHTPAKETRFEEFWKVYPRTRKMSKKKALKCWNARLKEGYTADQMLKATFRYAEDCRKLKTEEQFIKHPSTFLGPDLHFEGYVKPDKEVDTHGDFRVYTGDEYGGFDLPRRADNDTRDP
jgi:hypothetical protein